MSIYSLFSPLKLATIISITLTVNILATSGVFAQATLQNTNSGLQPQAGQTQDSVNTQNQVGGVQANNGQSVLNQNSTRPLGVVSDPKQSSPQTVVPLSDTLKTDITPQKNSSKTALIIILLVALIAIFTYIVRRGVTTNPATAMSANTVISKPYIRPEPARPPKKKKQSKKKRKKSAQL